MKNPAPRPSGRMWSSLLTGAALSASPCLGAGFDTQDLTWHGFFTGGIEASDSPQSYHYGLKSQADMGRLSRLGLTVEKRLDNRWSLAAQLLATDRQVTLDWAFLSYYPVTNLTLRLGRQKMPIWLISDHIDVGHTYPWVSPPEEVYRLNPINNLSGLGATYRLPLGSYGLIFDGFASGTAPQHYELATQSTAASSNSGTVRSYSSANLAFESDQLLLRFAYARAISSIATDDFKIERLDASFYSVGFKTNYKDAILLGEYAASGGHVPQDEMARADSALGTAQVAAAAPGALQNPAILANLQQAYKQSAAVHTKLVGGRGWYSTAAYQLGNFQPMVTAARLRSPKDSSAAGDQDSVTGGCRYDINLNTDFKLQAKHIWPRHNSRGLLDTPSDGSTVAYHQLNVYSAAVNVAF